MCYFRIAELGPTTVACHVCRLVSPDREILVMELEVGKEAYAENLQLIF